MYKYRIAIKLFYFEPQMKCIAGENSKHFWSPLLVTGYWADPKSYNYGVVNKSSKMSYKNASISINRAKLINGVGLLSSVKNIT